MIGLSMTLPASHTVESPSQKRVIAALVVIQVLFGLNYVVTKSVVGHFPPLVWASIRIAICSVIMFAVAQISKRPHPPKTREFFVPLVGLALLGSIINQGSFLVGLHYTTSTNSAVLNTLIPVFTLLIVTIRGQERLTLNRAIGFVLALAGVLVIRRVEEISFSDATVLGDLLMIVNCLSYALFLSVGKSFLEKYDPIWTTAYLFLYGTIGLTLLAVPDYMRLSLPPMTSELVAAALYAVLGATLATYFLSNWTLRYAKSSQVALFIYIQPVIASLVAWSWMGEVITLRTSIASLLIFLGMLFALTKPKAQVTPR